MMKDDTLEAALVLSTNLTDKRREIDSIMMVAVNKIEGLVMEVESLRRLLIRADSIINRMSPYLGKMAIDADCLRDLNDHGIEMHNRGIGGPVAKKKRLASNRRSTNRGSF